MLCLTTAAVDDVFNRNFQRSKRFLQLRKSLGEVDFQYRFGVRMKLDLETETFKSFQQEHFLSRSSPPSDTVSCRQHDQFLIGNQYHSFRRLGHFVMAAAVHLAALKNGHRMNKAALLRER